MKKWNEPKVWKLGVKNTAADDCTENCFLELMPFSVDGKNQHWCHKVNNGAGGWHDNGCNEPRSNHHQTPDDPAHNWDGEDHTSKCCCGLS